MLKNVQLQDLLVLDLETVSQFATYQELDDEWQELWAKKAGAINNADVNAALVYDRAAIYAEFGKIVCIGLGIFYLVDGEINLKVKSIAGHDEKAILIEFVDLLNTHFNIESKHRLVAHNGKEFDFP